MSGCKLGFVSTRFSGTDGVSLEAAKWAELLWHHEHVSYWFAGKLDRASDISMEVPEAYFKHPDNLVINDAVYGRLKRSKETTVRIQKMAAHLKNSLYEFVDRFDIDILIVQNALCIPMHLPLGVAITHFTAETEFPVIAHHHDFYWERDRFAVNAVSDYLQMAFPPAMPTIQHVTINSAAQNNLAHRKGVPSMLIPNVLDFENPPPPPDDYAADFRQQIGLSDDDILVLQPTRVVPRKGIEHAIHLLNKIGDPRYKLVITHESGDEGLDYERALAEMARGAGVDLRFVHTRIDGVRGLDEDGCKVYSLNDVYPHADLVTYTSLYEGFGNALLEAFYFRRPVVLNRYSIFVSDIEPKGFRVIPMNGIMTEEIVDSVKKIVEDKKYCQEIVDHNYDLARSFFSYAVLRRQLGDLIGHFTGSEGL